MIAAFGPVDEMVVNDKPLNKDNSLILPQQPSVLCSIQGGVEREGQRTI